MFQIMYMSLDLPNASVLTKAANRARRWWRGLSRAGSSRLRGRRESTSVRGPRLPICQKQSGTNTQRRGRAEKYGSSTSSTSSSRNQPPWMSLWPSRLPVPLLSSHLSRLRLITKYLYYVML